ncbi:FAD-dependent monooxygenase [Streptomyces sp. HNM0574]|uniref:FAD-dependent monooxygenase n=1 Tax=Streptomyces sp. HNM0574 TaxID=2714954 RepID=UPI00146A7832|nr:FAD-dependent monooxygenase [Streptomyces sp. HNM0574]NLU66288.1 NAD(P)-binding protein [Streptomyces sp. HNM0574]
MSTPRSALICGAGIAGLALAARLRHHGWEVLVVDAAPGPREQGYMIDFFGPGFEALTDMGLEPELRRLGHRTSEFRYVDERGRTRAAVDYARFERAARGGLVSIMRPDLERLLREHVTRRRGPVELRYGTTVDAVADGEVTLSDGTRHRPDVLVGADGIHSRVRSLVLGPERDFLRRLGMHTGAFVFEDAELFRRMRGRFTLTDTTHRQMGFYGLDGDRVAVFTVHRSGDTALPADPREALRREYRDAGGPTRRALELCPPGERVYYDEVAQIVAPRWSAGNTVLVGDAAHAVSLIAGQGASLGVAGAYLLAGRLAAADSVRAALAEYERRWRPVVGAVQEHARDRVGEWFLPRSRTKLVLRRWGFRAMNVPGADRLLGNALLPKSSTPVTELSAL